MFTPLIAFLFSFALQTRQCPPLHVHCAQTHPPPAFLFASVAAHASYHPALLFPSLSLTLTTTNGNWSRFPRRRQRRCFTLERRRRQSSMSSFEVSDGPQINENENGANVDRAPSLGRWGTTSERTSITKWHLFNFLGCLFITIRRLFFLKSKFWSIGSNQNETYAHIKVLRKLLAWTSLSYLRKM